MKYKTITEIKKEVQHKLAIDKIKYNLKLNKKRFFLGFGLFGLGFWNPTPLGSIGFLTMLTSLPICSIDFDKYLIKLRRLKYRK